MRIKLCRCKKSYDAINFSAKKGRLIKIQFALPMKFVTLLHRVISPQKMGFVLIISFMSAEKWGFYADPVG
jgi:hypothetical protein